MPPVITMTVEGERDLWQEAFISALSESASKLVDSPGTPATGGDRVERLVERAALIADAAISAFKARWEDPLSGWVLMPEKLSAENGAKALLIGEFTVGVSGDVADDAAWDVPPVAVPWDVIKDIYAKAVDGLGREVSL